MSLLYEALPTPTLKQAVEQGIIVDISHIAKEVEDPEKPGSNFCGPIYLMKRIYQWFCLSIDRGAVDLLGGHKRIKELLKTLQVRLRELPLTIDHRDIPSGSSLATPVSREEVLDFRHQNQMWRVRALSVDEKGIIRNSSYSVSDSTTILVIMDPPYSLEQFQQEQLVAQLTATIRANIRDLRDTLREGQ